MPGRLEAIVRSPIAFRRKLRDSPDQYSDPPETVGIEFDGRLFVWHAFTVGTHDPIFGDRELGPSVTSVLGDDAYAEVAAELERFLTALAYYYEQPAEAVAYGSHFTPEPFETPIARAPRTPGLTMIESPKAVSLRRDSVRLLKALAWYREGQNAGSPFYRFLAFWNCLDAVFEEEAERDRFVESIFPTLASAWGDFPLPASPAKDFREASRNAIAHVIRPSGRPVIDPDADIDRQRLQSESRFLNKLVRAAIEQEFDRPVTA